MRNDRKKNFELIIKKIQSFEEFPIPASNIRSGLNIRTERRLLEELDNRGVVSLKKIGHGYKQGIKNYLTKVYDHELKAFIEQNGLFLEEGRSSEEKKELSL